jgi:imidazolonepropionase
MTVESIDTLFVNFRIATLCDKATDYGRVEGMAIGVSDGKIAWIEPKESAVAASGTPKIVEGKNRWLTPGLIDCHTHLVYGGNRAKEWELRLSGVSYEEISRGGGGILSSVNSTRAASEEELLDSASSRLKFLQAEGVTTVEIKSGYGLDVETELKMLRAANRLRELNGIDVETTLLGAHAVPPEFRDRPDEYIDLVCKEMIPAAKDICTSVDVFCESIAFNVEQTRRVFESALDAGLQIKVHAEQLSDLGMAAEAARMGAISADHLEYLSPADAKVLAENNTVATLLPGAFYCLNETQKPPVAELLKQGANVAIATDSNPGSSPSLSLLMMGNMACNLFGMTPEQSLVGITRNAAKALNLNDRGTIEVGKLADFAVWEVESPSEILYQIGGNPCVGVYKRGKLVVAK